MDVYKYQLIDKYILPFFSKDIGENEALKQDLHKMFKLDQVLKREVLELSGSAEDGRMWFAITSLVHSYYICQNNKKQRGHQIWNSQQFILDCNSLLEDSWRHDFLQALEPGEFLSIQFDDLRLLMQKYPFVKSRIEVLSAFQQQNRIQHMKLLKEPADDRVRLLHDHNPLFIACSSHEIQAMHLNMSRRTYRDHLRNLEKIKN